MELDVAKIGGTGVIDTVTKIYGAHCCKNGLSSLWHKWVELTVAKMGETGAIDTVTKKGVANYGKNGQSTP